MIDYDSFSRCHLTDIFFAFHAGAKELMIILLKESLRLYEQTIEIITDVHLATLFFENLKQIFIAHLHCSA